MKRKKSSESLITEKLKFYGDKEITDENIYGKSLLNFAAIADTLIETGFDEKEVREFFNTYSMEGGNLENQINMLKKYRVELLDDIHLKQKQLDKLDYIIYEIKKCRKDG